MKAKTLPKVMYHECARCGGDLCFEREEKEYVCLQCGRTTPIAALQDVTRMAGAPARAETYQDRELTAA